MIIGALVFLIIGFIELMLFQIMVYPILRARFEAAKVTGSQGIDPVRVTNFVKLQSLILMPIVGFYVGKTFGNAGG